MMAFWATWQEVKKEGTLGKKFLQFRPSLRRVTVGKPAAQGSVSSEP